MMHHKIICGHVLDVLSEMPSESVDCIVTSPPYWGLRLYPNAEVEWNNGITCQLGLEPSLDMYIDHMLQITAELKRVLKKTGVMFWNQGDNYSGSGKGYGSIDPKWKDARGKVKPIKTDIPQKCMCLQNYRLILKLLDDLQKWELRDDLTKEEREYVVKELVKAGILK